MEITERYEKKAAVTKLVRVWQGNIEILIILAIFTSAYLSVNPLLGWAGVVVLLAVLSRKLENSHRLCGYIVFTVCIFIMKLVLVSGNEIVSTQHDAWSYVATANGASWRRLGATPGYPIWLWLSMSTGLPQRIVIEVFYILASTVFSVAIGRRFFGFLGYALILALTVFSPVSYFLFDLALSDGFYICLTLLAVGLSVISVQKQRREMRWLVSILLGVTLGVMAITRKEVVMLAALVLLLLVLSVVLMVCLDKKKFRQAFLIGLYRTVVISVIAFSVVLSILTVHWNTEGVVALSGAELSSHMRLLKNLTAIEVKSKQQRFVPVSSEARFLAYRYSPTLSELKPIIESRDNVFQIASLNFGLPAGEIGAGWIWHVFNAATAEYGIRTARQLDEFYIKINSELDAAFDSGKLNKRFVLHPLLGYDVAVWLPFVGNALVDTIKAATLRVYGPQIDEKYEADLFDRVCLRRAALIPQKEGFISGWVFADKSKIASISIETKINSSTWEGVPSFHATRISRKDVQEVYEKNGEKIELNTGFRAKIPIIPNNIRLKFLLEDGEVIVADNPTIGRVNSIFSLSKTHKITFAVDGLPNDAIKQNEEWRNQIMSSVENLYTSASFWIMCSIVAIAGLIKLTKQAVSGDNEAMISLIGGLVILCMLIFKLGFYAIIDAAAWSVEPRYVQV